MPDAALSPEPDYLYEAATSVASMVATPLAADGCVANLSRARYCEVAPHPWEMSVCY